MTENSRKIYGYLKDNHGKKLTANEIKDALGVTISAVTGSVNGLVKKGFAVREEVSVAGADGKPSVIKYIALTDAGLDFDPDAEPEKKAKK